MLFIIVFVMFVLIGLLLMAFGGYALYEGFTHEESERSMFGDAKTARNIGIVAMALGLLLVCALVVGGFYFFFVGVSLG